MSAVNTVVQFFKDNQTPSIIFTETEDVSMMRGAKKWNIFLQPKTATCILLKQPHSLLETFAALPQEDRIYKIGSVSIDNDKDQGLMRGHGFIRISVITFWTHISRK